MWLGPSGSKDPLQPLSSQPLFWPHMLVAAAQGHVAREPRLQVGLPVDPKEPPQLAASQEGVVDGHDMGTITDDGYPKNAMGPGLGYSTGHRLMSARS